MTRCCRGVEWRWRWRGWVRWRRGWIWFGDRGMVGMAGVGGGGEEGRINYGTSFSCCFSPFPCWNFPFNLNIRQGYVMRKPTDLERIVDHIIQILDCRSPDDRGTRSDHVSTSSSAEILRKQANNFKSFPPPFPPQIAPHSVQTSGSETTAMIRPTWSDTPRLGRL